MQFLLDLLALLMAFPAQAHQQSARMLPCFHSGQIERMVNGHLDAVCALLSAAEFTGPVRFGFQLMSELLPLRLLELFSVCHG